ncbi:MAG TPA: tyrosine--tRNA ligase [Spirochaetia bacterium]|nr:tyrosine--tRNA ligase [Spirochaetia bacterium]
MTDALTILKERHLFKQCSDEAGLAQLMSQGPVSLYCGFDPTGSSLTIGHMIPVMAMAHLQRAGHRPVALVGGGTCRIGDPTGKSEMRKLLDDETIAANSRAFRQQLGQFLDFTHDRAVMADNADWLLKLNYIEMLRDVGVHFSVNRMLAFETYKMRWETGLSFIEFNYIILQSYDFMKLNQTQGVRLQVGGDDQWGNMVSGIDLTRRMSGEEVFVLTFPLLTTADGKKMGKTEKGAVFLDKDKTPVFEFYQYWRNVHDDDVAKFFKIFTFRPIAEIDALCAHRDQRINEAKAQLAWDITALVHGKPEADQARAAAQGAFGHGAADLGAIPHAELSKDRIAAGVTWVDLIAEAGLAPSKREARQLVVQGGASVNDVKVESPDAKADLAHLKDGAFLVKAGKKRLFRFTVA